MKETPPQNPALKVDAVLSKVEWAAAIALTLVVVYFHFVLWRNAGGLWRDEQNTVYISTLPSFSELWGNLQFDSFPVVWFTVVRAWSSLGMNGDSSLRLLGLVVGLLLIAALWWNSRQFKQPAPLVALTFLAFNPTVMFWGDSLRAYGLGAIISIVLSGTIWKYLEHPSRKNAIATAVVAVLAVQTLYYNTILLLAFGLAGAAVAVRRRSWRQAIVILSIGGLAAVSLLPYAQTIRHYGEANKVQHIQTFTLHDFYVRVSSALNVSGVGAMIGIWIGLFVIASALAIFLQFRPQPADEKSARKDISFYFLVAMIVGTVGYFLFLKWVKLPTNPWHYILLLSLIAISLERIFSVFIQHSALRVTRLALLVALALSVEPRMEYMSQLRQTNADLAAAKLKSEAQKEDLIVLCPWYLNVSFKAYYNDDTPIVTVPPLPNPRVHRYDLIAEAIAKDPVAVMEPVLKKIQETLQSGHRVWVFGAASFENIEQPLVPPPPAPQMPSGWLDEPYYVYWSMRLGQFLGRHAETMLYVSPTPPNPVASLEGPPLLMSTGWRN